MTTPGQKWNNFAAVYNDVVAYPSLSDVAIKLGYGYQTVRNYATTLRRLRMSGADVPELIGRRMKIEDVAANDTPERLAETGALGFEPVLPGFAISSTSTQMDDAGVAERSWIKTRKIAGEEFALPEGQVIKGVSALVDPEGRTLAKWIKTREGIEPLDAAEILKAAFLDFEPAALPRLQPFTDAQLLTLIPCNDWHIGMHAWEGETGQNWDLKIATRTIGDAIEQLIDRTLPSAQAVILGGGDLLHADSQENRTAKSGNQLDVDGRYAKVLKAAAELKVRAIDAALRRHGHVTIRILKGNHDEHSAIAIGYFLLAWYRNEPRVTVDVDQSLFWWMRFDRVLLGATHGHSVKLKDMPMIMAHRRAEDWGLTRFRYAHGFHVHHKEKLATEGEGVICEAHQAPVPQDAWHYGSGFLSGRSLQAITYDGRYGEVSRARVAILDDPAAAAAA